MRALDSDHCIAILGGQLDLRSHVSPDEELALMAVNVGELVHGARKSTRPKENLTRLDIFFTALLVLPYDEGSARRFGVLKALLEHPDELISDMDLQIGSVAFENNASLFTHNQRHFARVPDLKLDDWLS